MEVTGKNESARKKRKQIIRKVRVTREMSIQTLTNENIQKLEEYVQHKYKITQLSPSFLQAEKYKRRISTREHETKIILETIAEQKKKLKKVSSFGVNDNWLWSTWTDQKIVEGEGTCSFKIKT